MPNYNPKAIEPRWQRFWQDRRTFATPDTADRPKYYILDMFPHPSGAGLHVGHPEGYTATDILARYRRMKGDHVLHPLGWDALGLPADQYDVQKQGEAAVRRYQDSKRLAYQSEVPVWWCPALGTVLANEEVIDGRSERGHHPCERRPLRQWVLRITAYADRLLNDLETVDWP